MPSPAVHRVVARLDAVSESRTTISTAAALAGRWRTRLHGLFVEDEELLRFAALPFARQATALPIGHETLDPDALEHAFRDSAVHARALLAKTAKDQDLDWTFETVRLATARTAPAFEEGDFVVMPGTSRPFAEHVRLPSRAARDIRRPTLLLGDRHRAHPVVVVLHGVAAESAERLLALALDVAQRRDASLTVVGRPADVRADDFGDWLGHAVPAALRLRIEAVENDGDAVARRLAALDGGLVALTVGHAAALMGALRADDLLLLP